MNSFVQYYYTETYIAPDFLVLSYGACFSKPLIAVNMPLFFCRYYGNGNTAKLPDCYNVDTLDSYIHHAVFFQATTEALQPQADVWLGETSSFYDGGAPHLSDTYVAGFL